jgi:anti-sigma factor RsiW
MNCSQARSLFSLYLDGALTGRQMQSLGAHFEECAACQGEYTQLRQSQHLLTSVGRPPVPPDLALKVRIALSQEMARARRPQLQGTKMLVEGALRRFMVPTAVGLVTAVIVFGVLMGSFAGSVQAANSNDVPLLVYAAPEFKASAYALQHGSISEDAVIVEAYIDASGRVEDYRVLSSPEDVQQWLPQVKNALIFTEFQPATAMGRPAPGRVVLAFTRSGLNNFKPPMKPMTRGTGRTV